jgi:hypothetical protein
MIILSNKEIASVSGMGFVKNLGNHAGHVYKKAREVAQKLRVVLNETENEFLAGIKENGG